MTTKQEWLDKIKNERGYVPYKPLSLQEYNLIYKQAKFKCPLHRKGDRMLFCDGRDCPTNMKTLETYEQDCMRARKYRSLIILVQTGWIKIEAP